MTDLDLTALLEGKPLSPEVIDRLRAIDRAELREVLGTYLDDEALDALERRIDTLLARK